MKVGVSLELGVVPQLWDFFPPLGPSTTPECRLVLGKRLGGGHSWGSRPTLKGGIVHAEQLVLSNENWIHGRRWGGSQGRAVYDFQVAVARRLVWYPLCFDMW